METIIFIKKIDHYQNKMIAEYYIIIKNKRDIYNKRARECANYLFPINYNEAASSA